MSVIVLTLLAACSGSESLPEPEPEPEPQKSDECTLLSLKLPAADNGLKADIVFDVTEQSVVLKQKYLTWIGRENPEMMIPVFTLSGGVASVGGVEITSGVTALSFAENVILKITAESGLEREYEIMLNCPQINKELPVVHVDPDSPVVSKDVYVQAKLDMYSPFTKEGWWDSSMEKVEIRGRGNSTWGLPKKPYRIKFPDKISPIGLNHCQAKSWTFLANDMDKSLIRDALGWEMSRIMFDSKEGYHDSKAILFTPCAQHVNFYMGDKYIGVYLMSDHMERAKGRIEVDKLEKADGADSEKITGGHIIEVNIHGESAPVRFLSGRCRIQMDHKYPKDDDYDPAQYSYIENFITKAENTLYSSNFKDPVNGWRKYFDIKTLADYIIIKELCGDMDGYTSSYLYKRRGDDRIFFGPIWDVDKGWENEVRGPADKWNMLMIHAGFQMPGCNGKDWYNRLWEDETLRAFVYQRWAQKRTELVSRAKALADELTAKMPKAIEANFTVWEFYYQYSQEAAMPAKTYALEVKRVKDLTEKRAAVLDKLFAQ